MFLLALRHWRATWQNDYEIQGLNLLIMGSLLYVIAIILIIGWALGFFVYSAGGLIHILLVIAVIAIVLRLIRGDRVV